MYGGVLNSQGVRGTKRSEICLRGWTLGEGRCPVKGSGGGKAWPKIGWRGLRLETTGGGPTGVVKTLGEMRKIR